MQAWNKISRMPEPAIKKLQNELLLKMINEELSLRSPYYRSFFRENNIDPARILGVDDLKRIPFTEKQDILPKDDDPLHPKQFVLEAPTGEAPGSKGKKKGFSLFGKKDDGPGSDDYRFHTLFYTAGRTDRPVPIEYTRYDVENLKEAGARAFDILGLTRDDTLINAFTYSPNAYFWQMFYSTTGLGSTALQTGGGKVLGMEKILKALDSMEAPVLVAAPGYAMFALQTLEHFGFSAVNLERIVTGIDYVPMAAVERMRKLMDTVGAKKNLVQRTYFLSEAKSGWAECEPGQGYHINPDHVLVEIVDPETGETMAEGERGEVVLTNLDTRGTTLLRYKTGDIATGGLVTEPCPHCKRTVPRIMGDIERKAMYFRLQEPGGPVDFDANALRLFMYGREDVLLWYSEINAGDTGDSLRVVIKGVSGTDEAALLKSVEMGLRAEFKLPLEVESSSLDAVAGKIGLEKYITEQYVFDNREG